MKFSILDQGLIDKNTTSEEAIQNSIKLAQVADKLGYFSYWVAEHHNVHSFSISCPEIMMMQLAHQTKNIKIGVASILFNLYSPLRTAEMINTMTSVVKKRFYFALGSNPGTKFIQKAFNYSAETSLTYQEKIKHLFHFLNIQSLKSIKNVRSVIQSKENKKMFLTTFTLKNAILAAKLGAGLIVGHNFLPDFENTKKIVKTYRKYFKKHWPDKEEKIIFPTFIVTAENEEKINNLWTPLKFFLLGEEDFNKFWNFPSLDDVKDRLSEEKEVESKLKILPLVGSPKYIYDQLLKVKQQLNIEHFLLIPMVNQIENRIKILELMQKEHKKRQNGKIC